jgi:hypothetical protein
MNRSNKKINPEVDKPEVEKDWQLIAKEIWDDLDILCLFLESHYDKFKDDLPFFQKMLSRRFKYFTQSRGRTLTAEEYAKEKERERSIMNLLMKK